jgi:hypothetical protein
MDNTLFGIAVLVVLIMAGIIVFVLLHTSVSAPVEDDPLVEAEVYLAHGRKRMAEEILERALRENPRRIDIQVKLYQLKSGQ